MLVLRILGDRKKDLLSDVLEVLEVLLEQLVGIGGRVLL
jgi:hypothetical protein